jgi:FUS-interacting serine-arginine-rich protein 1
MSSSAAAPAESLADSFSKMFLEDPIMKALWEGKMSWGDILCTPEEEERCRQRTAAREAEEAAERAERDALLAERAARDAARGYSKPRVSFADAPHKPTYAAAPVEREVPAFPAGRRTLMAKNLPRDIAVQELRTIFEKYGAIRDIYIPKNMDKSSPYFGTIKGFAKIQFLKPDDSATAFAAQYSLLNIRGKNIVLEPAAEDR